MWCGCLQPALSPLPPPTAPHPYPHPTHPPTHRLSGCLQYKFGLHRYVGQRVRLWSEETQEWREGFITSFGQR